MKMKPENNLHFCAHLLMIYPGSKFSWEEKKGTENSQNVSSDNNLKKNISGNQFPCDITKGMFIVCVIVVADQAANVETQTVG